MKNKCKLLFILSILSTLIACGPAEVPKYAEVGPSQSAYVIPLEGASKANQGKFDSASFLEEKKVAAKRIYIPLKSISTGRMWFDYKWIPTVRVILVDRNPVTFEWDKEPQNDNGISVESRDSIGFSVGINISAQVKEENTSLFLYNYPSGNIRNVLNKIVRSKTTEVLSREFAKYDLEGETLKNGKRMPGARELKGTIVETAKKELVTFFALSGVTINTFGLTGGLSYEDTSIQIAINANFSSELEIKNAINERLQQEEINTKNVSIATAEKDAAVQFAKAANARTAQVDLEIRKMNAEANLIRARNWKGDLPANTMMLPAGSDPGFIIDTTK